MDAQQFQAEFGHIANAPGAVTQLREMVLSLAFNGSLCAASSESIQSLLDDLERQREAANIETRKQRLTRKSANGSRLDGSFVIPESWRWVSLSTVGHTWGQKKPDEDFYYIDVSSIDNKAGALSETLEVVTAAAAPSRARKIVKKGTLVYSTVRPYLLNIAIVDRDFDREPIASTAFAVVHPWQGIEARYLYFYLRSPYFVRYVESVQIGMAYPAISDEKFYSGVVPLPPTEEQSRIVAKVDELMALCDKLEVQQQDRRKVQNVLRQSTLQAVAQAQSQQELRNTWTRLEANFGGLLSAPEDVCDYRDVIYDLALRGLLLSKASIQKIQSNGDRSPLPAGWQWKTMGELSDYITSGSRGWKQYLAKAGDAFIRSQDIKRDALIFEAPAYVVLPEKVEGKRTLVQKDDLLLTITGGNVGKCATVPNIPGKAYVSQHVALIRLHDPSLCEFIHFWMINPYGGRGFLSRYIYGDKPGLNLAQVGSVPIPVPLDIDRDDILKQLRGYQERCQLLEKEIKTKQELSAVLAKATVASMTGISLELQEDEPVKSPQTELIAPLRLGQTPDVKAQAPLATLLVRHNGEMSATDLWQRFGGEVDAFYDQLKIEVAHGWIQEPAVAEMREKVVGTAGA